MFSSIRLMTAVIFCAVSVCHAFAQDLTGTWEASETADGKKFKITGSLIKTAGGSYMSISEIKESTTIKVKPIRVNWNDLSKTRIDIKTNAIDKKASAMAQSVASFSKGVYTYADLGTIGETTLNVRLGSGTYTYSKTGKIEKLVSGNPAREYIKKSNDFPAEFADYAKELIEVTSFKFSNSEKTPKIKYSDRGVLSFSVRNNSEYDLQQLNVSIHLDDPTAEIYGLDGNNGTFSLGKQKSLNPEIDILSGFNLPVDSVRFTIVGSFNNVVLFTKKVSLPTIPFFLTETSTVAASSAKVLSILKPYYGLDKAPFGNITVPLDQFAQTGSKQASMWKAVFKLMGKGGYTADEETALGIAQKSYKEILENARKGDAEAQYLMFYAVGFGLTGDPSRAVAGAFLKRAADAGFLPAMYDYGQYLRRDSLYEDSYRYFLLAFNKGMQKAAADIGYFYQQGNGVEKDFVQAIDWYKKGDAFGDPEAMMYLARIYDLNEEGHQPDSKKVVAYATKAAGLKNAVALNYLARIYLAGRSGIARNVPKALALYKEASALGDNMSMTAMAYLYLEGTEGIAKNEAQAFEWAKKSAQAGGAPCMPLLAQMYTEGKVTPKDLIISRFWANQARLNGAGDADNTAQNARMNDMMNILTNIDLSDQHTIYRDTQTGDLYASNDGPDIVGGIFKSFMGAYKARRENTQTQVNGIKLIYTAGTKKVYGATISSKVMSSIMVNRGQKIKVASYGQVNFGMMAGTGGPDGVGGFQSYCVDPTLPHGAVMVKTAGPWMLAGSQRSFVAPSDGVLQFAINDVDAANNQGYFDLVITVE